ncbi:hypothetical protein PT974_08171 [Cladobotryum mycophilum]|uniref:Uncharacterized protein n=1 Tax=Cladobotryum mycophilum TaxID=491253 RepID=A0ABR0SCP6_9HYPO
MLFTAVTTVLSSFLAVSAGPIRKRELGGVLICTGANATGACDYKVYEMNKCHQLEAPFYENVGTFAPDGEPFFCFPRIGNCGSICTSPTGCTFGAVNFTYEHKYDIAAIKWNTYFRSFDCQHY